MGLDRFHSAVLAVAGWALFAAGSATGLAAAWVMAVIGRGTPLPLDAARELVIAGPYRVVRNPMAVSAIAQMAGVGVAFASPLTLVLAAGGGMVWNAVIRPSEEQFLAARFGAPYEAYRAAVRCWIPTIPPYPSWHR